MPSPPQAARKTVGMQLPPGPRGREVLGFFGGGSTAGTLTFLERSARRYGPLSYFRLLTQRAFLVDDADLVQEILVTRQHEFVRDNGATLLRELVGEGLLTRDEPQHRERRRLIQPAFHRQQISSYANSMIDEAERLAAEWNHLGAGVDEIDITREMKRLTLNIVGSALFGADFHENAVRIAAVLERVIKRSTWLGTAFAFLELPAKAYRRLRPNGRSLFFANERAELESILNPVLSRRRASLGNDMVSLLLAARDEDDGRLNDEDVRNEAVTMVLAGHETTATALTWTWYLLAQHPEVERKLHAELDAVLGERRPELDDLQHLSYTALVFKEAMRLYPPAILFGRRPKTDLKLAGYDVPRGSSIFVSPYITQRNVRYYENPGAFQPERWQRGEPPKFAYFPFGGGAKMCIGDSFARMEGVLVLASLARHWRLRNDSDHEVGIAPSVTLRPDRPLRMRLERRESAKKSLGQTAAPSEISRR
jgi:cytochrome P450